MNEVIKRRGRFALVNSDGGFAWTMAGPDGGNWYWHPHEAHWTACPSASPSPELATACLNLDGPKAAVQFRHPEAPHPMNSDTGGSP
jgi:hypothetical protein